MNERKKARSNVGTFEQAKDVLLDVAQEENNKDFRTAQGFIESILPCGEINAIKSDDLKDLAGIRKTRALRFQIEQERDNGAVILSSCRGYFRPSEDETTAIQEIEAWTRTVDARMKTNRRTVKSAKKQLAKLIQKASGQEVMPDV